MLTRSTAARAIAVTLAASLIALLLSGCGTSWLLMNDLKQFIDDAAPLQIWSGEVRQVVADSTWEDYPPVPGAVVVLEAIPPEYAEGEGLTSTWCAVTDEDGRYRMHYRWRKGWSYTVRASWYDAEAGMTYASKPADRGEVSWQDHEDNLIFEVASAAQL